MKRLILSASLLALAAPAWGQAQADYSQYISCGTHEADEIIICDWYLEDVHRDTVIVTASRIGFDRPDDLTAPISTITQTDIANRNQAVVADLLRTVPGLSVSQNGGAGSLTQLRLRGAEANHILVLIDGVEVANPADGAFDFGGLSTQDIVKIEVLRGEQSALYGSDAVGGVINILTRAGEARERWRANIEGGSRDTLDGGFGAVIPVGEAALSINGNAFTTGGYDIAGLDGEADGAKSRSLNLGLNAVELGGVTFSGKYGFTRRETDFDSDTDFDGRLDNTADETTVETATARVDARFDLGAIQNKITAHMVETETDTIGGFASNSTGARHGINWIAKADFDDVHRLTVLVEAEHEQYKITPNFTEAGAEPDVWTTALAGDYRFQNDSLTVSASARLDDNDLFDSTTTWRLGAGYAFPWEGRLRASLGTGIKNPTLVELFGFFPQSRFTGNPDLQPERSTGISVGYTQEIGNLSVTLDYFRSELKDEITTLFNPDFTSTVVNLESDSTREGIEIAADWRLADKFSVSGSASFLSSEQDGVEEIRRPDVLASATATWRPIEAVSLTLAVDHNGEQLDTDFATFSNVTLDSFTLVGANARWSVTDDAALTLRGTNLLDEQYQEIVGYASPGRGVFAGLELSF